MCCVVCTACCDHFDGLQYSCLTSDSSGVQKLSLFQNIWGTTWGCCSDMLLCALLYLCLCFIFGCSAPPFPSRLAGKSYREQVQLSTSELLQKRPQLLQRFLHSGYSGGHNGCKPEWKVIDWVIARHNDAITGDSMLFVKWKGLGHSAATFYPEGALTDVDKVGVFWN